MGVLIAAAVLAALAGFALARWAMQELEDAQRRKSLREEAGLAGEASAGLRPAAVSRIRGKRERERVQLDVERHVPEMLDAIALGMRSGLSFESALRLYSFRFDDRLALACRRACQSWESGLVERDEALRGVAEEFDVPSLSRFVANALRALRYGSPMGRMLEVLSSEARSCYRAKMEERVAKAPVKMLAPTAGLILPAMLIMMMGPVVLELIG
ncbi:type II secretion system F family protein [uncultured Slackia sp.]|uniref:type II secretion system F family protein n=1 Tax=uncultured Slackia sp. TaxID=665903 RepID=UPI0025E7BBE9|nr:type II secretion system F family protein [uncultured Slackia sp.]